jgi:hypothetical protein
MPWPPEIGGTTIRKITFVGGYLGKISLYDSGERCGPWASSFYSGFGNTLPQFFFLISFEIRFGLRNLLNCILKI